MSDARTGWRSGLRPALYLAAVVAVLMILDLSIAQPQGVSESVAMIAATGGIVFTAVLALYGTGVVQPADKATRRPVNRWLLALLAWSCSSWLCAALGKVNSSLAQPNTRLELAPPASGNITFVKTNTRRRSSAAVR